MKIEIFDTTYGDQFDALRTLLANAGSGGSIKIESITTAAVATDGGGAYHFVTVVYSEL